MIIYRTRLILSLHRCGISFDNFFMMLHTLPTDKTSAGSELWQLNRILQSAFELNLYFEGHKEEIFWPTRLDLLVLFKVHIKLDKYMYELLSKTQPFSDFNIQNFPSQRARQ